MRDLIVRLDVIDDGAASALRVIAHFDSLVSTHASVGALLRATATLTGCAVGYQDVATGRARRIAEDGAEASAEIRNPRGDWPVAHVDEDPDRVVWLERSGPAGPLDDLILERCAQALARTQTARAPLAAGELRVLLDDESPLDRRAVAARRLHLPATITVHAAIAPDAGTGASGPPSTVIDGLIAMVTAAGQEASGIPAGSRVGTCEAAADHAPQAWANARTALRLTGVGGNLEPTRLRFESLGALATVANHMTAKAAATDPDVMRIAALAADHPWVVGTMRALVMQPSVRQAAALLHLHHSTLQEREALVERHLGLSPRSATGRPRAITALLLWRLSQPLG